MVHACVYIRSKANRVEVRDQLVPSTISLSQELNLGHLGRKHLYPWNHFASLPHLKSKKYTSFKIILCCYFLYLLLSKVKIQNRKQSFYSFSHWTKFIYVNCSKFTGISSVMFSCSASVYSSFEFPHHLVGESNLHLPLSSPQSLNS